MPQLLDNRSQKTEEIIDKMPHWLIRWGITLFFGIACFFLVISLIVQYPDVFKERVLIKKTPGKATIAEMYIRQQHLHQVKKGQTIRLKLVSYPAKTYGIINGTISNIAQEPRAKDFRLKVTIALPKKGITSLGKIIAYRNNLLALGEIILQKRTLFQRLFGV